MCNPCRAYLEAMIDDLYSARILSLAANLPLSGRLDAASQTHGLRGTGEQVAKLCGSQATVDLVLSPDGLTVMEFAQDIRACALGQAAAAILGHSILESHVDEVTKARDAMIAMLKSDGDGPIGRFEGLRALKGVSAYPARHASTLVGLEATLKAIQNAQSDLQTSPSPASADTPLSGVQNRSG